MFTLDPLERTTSGVLFIVARATDSKRGAARYFTRCACGKQTLFNRSELVGRRPRRSCGCQGQVVRWSNEDLDYLRAEFPASGRDIAGDLNRTSVAVIRKALDLGVRFEGIYNNPRYWTEEDDALIRKHYPNGGSARCLPLFPTRTKQSVRERAHDLGIKCKKDQRYGVWNRAERKIVLDHYATGGWSAVQKLLPHRSHEAILSKARELGVHIPPAWTVEEEDELRLLYPKGLRACRERWPNRTDYSITGKARNLGLNVLVRGWTEAEVELVRQLFPVVGTKGVQAYLPRRSREAISALCMKYKIRFHGWTEDEEALVREHYPTRGAGFLSRLLGRHSCPAVHHKARALGLKSLKIWTEGELSLLAEHYPIGGSARVRQFLPQKTAESVRSKANERGIHWTGPGSRGSKGGQRARNTIIGIGNEPRAIHAACAGDQIVRPVEVVEGDRLDPRNTPSHGGVYSTEESLAA